MESAAYRAIAVVGVGAILPDADNATAFWENVKNGRYSITEVPRERWNPADYYDPDPAAPDKSYSKIGGWVRDDVWEPAKWHLPIPPRVANAMDGSQKWAIACTREALNDYGYPNRPLDPERTAVILGNAMAGEKHYLTVLRILFPEYAHCLDEAPSFAALPPEVRDQVTRELYERMRQRLPQVTEDTMPGELSNCIAGRIANLFNFRGPNYVVDAACASAMAAISSAVEGLIEKDFDVAVTGGIDRNMGASTFVKFCKIGALSATGTRPYAEGADGFVMGEGAVVMLLKRLADAERDGDRIYAVLRGIGGSSDGKGKGITAPNPIGQKLSVERAWQNAGLSPATATMIEGHGTSTRVGDVVEVQSMAEVLKSFNLPPRSVPLGSVKSNIGHLKSAAGAAGLLKAVLAIHHKALPPSLHCERTNPDIDFGHLPVYVNTELKPWIARADVPRRAGVSAFGFGGTNFHAVLEEHVPGSLTRDKRSIAVGDIYPSASTGSSMDAKQTIGSRAEASSKLPLRGALVIGAGSVPEVTERLKAVQSAAEMGRVPKTAAPCESDLRAPERVAIDYAGAADLIDKTAKALKALASDQAAMWKALRPMGIFRGHGAAPKVAFLYTGQGSQYINMLRELCSIEPIVAKTFAEADQVLTPLLGKPLTEFLFVDESNADAVAKAEQDLRQTAITQPAVLATDIALTRLLAAYGIQPDMTMGHSLGEYGALVAADALPFADALEAVSARGREMTRVSMKDNGRMAAVFAPLEEIERIVKTINGYVVVANINSDHQAVIGGASDAIQQAMDVFQKAGYHVVGLPVSHAFHTSIVAPASEPLRQVLERLHLQSPRLPIVANINGEFYPSGPNVRAQMLDILAQQVAAPVQFVKGLRKLYEAEARVFIETGPKKALQGFVDDVFRDCADVMSLNTNAPKAEIAAFNQGLCGLYAAGLGRGVAVAVRAQAKEDVMSKSTAVTSAVSVAQTADVSHTPAAQRSNGDRYNELGRMFADVLERGWKIFHGDNVAETGLPVAITGAALGLPGTARIFDDENVARVLRGEQLIDIISTQFRKAMLDKHITRLVKSEDGGPTFETITDLADVIKLAGRGHSFNLEEEFGVSADRLASLDRVTQLAIAAGIDALRDGGIPLVLRYKSTSKGTFLPDRWGLPDALRDDTGIIFGSAFPGYDAFADEMSRYYADHGRHEQLATLERLRARAAEGNGDSVLCQEIDRRIDELRAAIDKEPYVFDRRFLFRVLSMGHSQFAEFIGARGPNTQINSACATTTQAVVLAEDWIRTGRCRRVVIVSADDVTSDNLIGWMGAGFLASGAAATDEAVEEAAIPFDRRRHGLIMGMGAAAIVVESQDAVRERGIRPICEVVSAVTANSAFHGSRLDVQHICGVMDKLMAQAEARNGIRRDEIAPQTVFVSHETYTPARGGSASAEIFALRHVFGDLADRIVIANTKGFTGHAMATGIEDVVAIKTLETGCVPPVPNFKEVDPELGELKLSKGGMYPVEYALRLGAGFGSQISMTLMRWVKTKDGVRPRPNALGYAYRITDKRVWENWLRTVAGYASPDLEIVHRTLRVRDQGAPAKLAASASKLQKEAAPALITENKTEPKPAPPVREIAESGVKAKAVAAAAAAGAPAVVRTAPSPVEAPRPAAVTARESVTVQQPGAAEDQVKTRILALVAEKTGYPIDMLDVDLDLEADLGVDTVKQAEVFATIREAYGIPRDEKLKLREFPTLAHVIRFVHERRPDLVAEIPSVGPPKLEEKDIAAPAPPVVTQPAPKQSAGDVQDSILALVVEKTGYPREMLDLDLDLEADLGIDTVKQAELFAAIRQLYDIPRDQNLKLRDFPTLSHVIRFVYERRPDLATAPAVSSVDMPVPGPAATVPAKPIEESATIREPEQKTPAIETSHEDSVKEKVLDIVAEKTGYPKDMLDMDLDLEADLGIDTVKQAEMFAAIRAMYNIPRDQNLKLRDFPTLSHVVQFVHDRRTDLVATDVPVKKTQDQPRSEAGAAISEASQVPESKSTTIETNTKEAIKQKVLDIVAEKTGYPKDMLDLDLDLEADLGIDTVKQAEMFAAIRAAYNIPRDQNLKLRDFPTLAHVITFALERQGPVSAQATAAKAVAAPEVKEKSADDQSSASPPKAPARAVAVIRPKVATFDAANKIPRRVPVPVLRPPLGMCKPTGVTLGPGSRVVIMPDRGNVAQALTTQLQKLGAQVLTIEGAEDVEAVTQQLQTWMTAGPVQGVYWLPALDNEGPIERMDLSAWHDALRVRVKALYTTMRAMYEQVAPSGTFLVSATGLGGQHGYEETGATAPLGGAVVGFTKAYKRERTDALVKAVDFEPQVNPEEVAEKLIAETIRDPGAIEIGHKQGLRWTIGLQEQSAADGQPGLKLDENTVFLITGAAGSIVSAITSDLANASGGTFYLLDVVPEPDPDNPDLKRFIADKEGLKRDLFVRIQARGQRATPALVEKELAALERAQAARSAIEAVEAAGGKAHYFSVDLTNADAVAKVIERVREQSGRIDVLLHAAGIERSHFLPDKDPREFDLVFDVKSDGFFNLLHAIGEMPLGATVAFSSVAGRFGNGGQTDYSSANDLLCKITSSFRNTRPGARGIVIDWTAWGGIGMATRGSIPKMMELAGIDMLPPEAGIPLIRRELTSGGTRGEVVIAERLGMMMKELDDTGGVDPTAAQDCGEIAAAGPMVGKITRAGVFEGVTIETTLDPKIQPFLHDHQIDGTPVLPGVMGIEAFAEAAQCLLPEWHVDAVEDVNFLAAFKFYRNEPRTVRVQAQVVSQGHEVIAYCRLTSERLLPNQKDQQITTHFTGRVRLSRQERQPIGGAPVTPPTGNVTGAAEIYRVYFHGPAYQVVGRAWRDGDRTIGEMAKNLPWHHHPPEKPLLMSPRLIELCFQTAGLWEVRALGRFGLPHHVEKISVWPGSESGERTLYAVVTPNQNSETFDAEVVDANGTRYLCLTGYRTVAVSLDIDAKPVKALQTAA